MGLAMGLSLEKPGSPLREWNGLTSSCPTQHSSKNSQRSH
jgi:hypothetical protein